MKSDGDIKMIRSAGNVSGHLRMKSESSRVARNIIVVNTDIRVQALADGSTNSSKFHHFLDLGSSKRAVYKIPLTSGKLFDRVKPDSVLKKRAHNISPEARR